jgi:glyoxylase-like metal-dependent hydrolase (beta-lactamase superfamily II)
MNVIPFVHEGLGNSSYLVEVGDGAAALVDPDRTTARYLAAAEARGWQIGAALETHLHADFVSGVRQLGDDGVPRLFLPAAAAARFPHEALVPGARLRLGERAVEVIASPGHTPEHVSYVIHSPAGPPALFSGGSLLVGGAARTDLIAPEQTDALSRAQYRTLTQAFAALPDETRLYPTHGGGSFCAAGGGGERSSTLGRERATNPWLTLPDEDAFARAFPATFPAAPAYFFRLRPVNQAGPRLRRDIPLPPPLGPAAFDAARRQASRCWWATRASPAGWPAAWTPGAPPGCRCGPPRSWTRTRRMRRCGAAHSRWTCASRASSRPATSRAPATSRWAA